MPRLGVDARHGLSRPRQLAMDAAGYGIGAVLAALAAARAGKAVHPDGVVYRARLIVDGVPAAPGESQLLSRRAEHPTVLRFSRSVGVPRPVPDLLGVSLRGIDAYGRDRHQDVMMVSSIGLPVLHHLFVPATDFQQRPYSSSLPYRAGDDTFLIGVVPDPDSPRLSGDDEFDRLARAAATGRLLFGVAVAPIGGRFRRIASLHVEHRLPHTFDSLRFNPFNCGAGLEPTGVLNRLRDYAYPMSQAAWSRRGERGRAQQRAETDLRDIAGAAGRSDSRLPASRAART